MQKDLNSNKPFPNKKHRVLKGAGKTHLKHSKVKKMMRPIVHGTLATDTIKGTLKSSGGKGSHKRTVTKA